MRGSAVSTAAVLTVLPPKFPHGEVFPPELSEASSSESSPTVSTPLRQPTWETCATISASTQSPPKQKYRMFSLCTRKDSPSISAEQSGRAFTSVTTVVSVMTVSSIPITGPTDELESPVEEPPWLTPELDSGRPKESRTTTPLEFLSDLGSEEDSELSSAGFSSGDDEEESLLEHATRAQVARVRTIVPIRRFIRRFSIIQAI